MIYPWKFRNYPQQSSTNCLFASCWCRWGVKQLLKPNVRALNDEMNNRKNIQSRTNMGKCIGKIIIQSPKLWKSSKETHAQSTRSMILQTRHVDSFLTPWYPYVQEHVDNSTSVYIYMYNYNHIHLLQSSVYIYIYIFIYLFIIYI